MHASKRVHVQLLGFLFIWQKARDQFEGTSEAGGRKGLHEAQLHLMYML